MKSRVKYYFYRILANFSFGEFRLKCKRQRDKYISTAKIFVNGENNKFDLQKIYKNNININISGDNNIVEIGDNCSLKGLCIHIYGNGNYINFSDSVKVYRDLIIVIGHEGSNKIENSGVFIGEHSGLVSVRIQVLEPNTQLDIGKNCMISENVTIFLSDGHSVLDNDNRLLNYGKGLKIGNNVWLSEGVKIGKNANIPDDTIVGWYSVVMSKFTETNTVIAGNPAKVVKREVHWSYLSPQAYLDEKKYKGIEKCNI